MELAGKVIADPARAGLIQAPFDGRLEAGPRGLPLPGQSVKAGDVVTLGVSGLGEQRQRCVASA